MLKQVLPSKLFNYSFNLGKCHAARFLQPGATTACGCQTHPEAFKSRKGEQQTVYIYLMLLFVASICE